MIHCFKKQNFDQNSIIIFKYNFRITIHKKLNYNRISIFIINFNIFKVFEISQTTDLT